MDLPKSVTSAPIRCALRSGEKRVSAATTSFAPISRPSDNASRAPWRVIVALVTLVPASSVSPACPCTVAKSARRIRWFGTSWPSAASARSDTSKCRA
ncbi:hypothetical protein ROTAS13_03622 [Roseomonas sp. TAS13]|nr:hypothetical protein ROTAS13_03622 [Roseomonas sp. TAS13]